MSDSEKNPQANAEPDAPDVENIDIEELPEEPAPGAGLADRMRQLFNAAHLGQTTRQDLKRDRTRPVTLLIGGTVGAVLLFIGLFSTPTRTPVFEAENRATPALGRPAETERNEQAQSSVTPLLNAQVQSGDINRGQLSPADILGTSRQAATVETDDLPGPETAGSVDRIPDRLASSLDSANSPDPPASYEVDTAAVAPTSTDGVRAGADSGGASSTTYSYGATGSTASATFGPPDSITSSIVFVRERAPLEADTEPTGSEPINQQLLLPPGARLMARLESAATTAVATPVVASIEYNYERGGLIVVPAGTKAIGEVRQASPEGYLDVRFHTLQMPNGRMQAIEATAMATDYRLLKGDVSGRNTFTRVLSRILSGVGSVAAYVVGAGGSGLGRSITGETLLRDRVASNIALAGEQELANAAYTQNIAVTVPANTRFYVVLQRAAETVAEDVGPSPDAPSPQGEIPTVQELRELMELRREINRMYLESASDP